MTPSNSSYNQIYNTHGEDTWVFLSVYIKEIDDCFVKLDLSITQKDITESRAQLHQMIGATRILNYVELEEKLVILQSKVKSSEGPKNCTQLLAEIQSHLDNIFAYALEKRPNYNVYLLAQKESTLSMVKELLEPEVKVACTYSTTVEDCMTWLSSNDADLVMVDSDENSTMLEELSNHFVSAYIETPVLLIKDNSKINIAELTSKYPNLNGCILKSASSEKWIESIKTIVNGRAYW